MLYGLSSLGASSFDQLHIQNIYCKLYLPIFVSDKRVRVFDGYNHVMTVVGEEIFNLKINNLKILVNDLIQKNTRYQKVTNKRSISPSSQIDHQWWLIMMTKYLKSMIFEKPHQVVTNISFQTNIINMDITNVETNVFARYKIWKVNLIIYVS